MGTNCFNIICLVSKKCSLGSLNSDLFYLDNVHLVENGNLKVAESIFSFINNFDKIKHNIHIQFNKSCKMAVSFKLNNADFPSLSFPNLSVMLLRSFSLPYATTCNSLSDNVSLSSKHRPRSSNKHFPMVSHVLCGTFVPNKMHISHAIFCA